MYKREFRVGSPAHMVLDLNQELIRLVFLHKWSLHWSPQKVFIMWPCLWWPHHQSNKVRFQKWLPWQVRWKRLSKGKINFLIFDLRKLLLTIPWTSFTVTHLPNCSLNVTQPNTDLATNVIWGETTHNPEFLTLKLKASLSLWVGPYGLISCCWDVAGAT